MKIRIVTDCYSGYEVQVRRWYSPFWKQLGGSNTHATIEHAEKYALRASKRVIKYVNLKQELRKTSSDEAQG